MKIPVMLYLSSIWQIDPGNFSIRHCNHEVTLISLRDAVHIQGSSLNDSILNYVSPYKRQA
jgi:hypothetical protein